MPTTRKLYGKRLTPLAVATAVVLTGGFALAAFYAPIEADQGFSQKIFYVHVPLAIVALCGFIFGGICAIQYLRTGDSRHDLRAYTAIHQSLIFCAGALVTGSIWAKAAWGQWWVWDEPTLVSFLIVFLLYATYQPLRFSIEDPEKQARYAAVFAVVAGAFVPLNFIAVRLAQPADPPARAELVRREPAERHARRLLHVPDRHGTAVRNALEIRDGLQTQPRPAACAEAQALRPGRGRCARAQRRRRRSPPHERQAARQRRLRRRRLPRLPRRCCSSTSRSWRHGRHASSAT